MTKVFIGGSRKITRLSAEVRRRLDRIIEGDLPILIGDAPGADKAVQGYLHDKKYRLVEIFCAGDASRNNLGAWPTRTISANGTRKDFGFYAAKDQAMAAEASLGLMIWDGKSVGTLMNMYRLVRQGKSVVAYVAPLGKFVEIKSWNDWEQFIESCAGELQRRVEREANAETHIVPVSGQASLL